MKLQLVVDNTDNNQEIQKNLYNHQHLDPFRFQMKPANGRERILNSECNFLINTGKLISAINRNLCNVFRQTMGFNGF